MIIREAGKEDIKQMMHVRLVVKENTLSNPALITEKDYDDYLFHRGKGWVSEIKNRIVGFSIVDLIDHNVCALFLQPDFEKRGIGRKLHDIMIGWYFSQTDRTLWLGTSPSTRAESFYRKAGWTEAGIHGKNEIKFEMTFQDWMHRIHAV